MTIIPGIGDCAAAPEYGALEREELMQTPLLCGHSESRQPNILPT
jgi:hypothetical protein